MFDNSFFGGAYQSTVPYTRPQAYMQPQPMPRMMGMSVTDLISVNGRAGADAFRLDAPNSRVALFDANDDVFYIKATDGAGYPTVKTFRFCELTDATPAVHAGDFISREEFNKFKTDLEEAMRNVQQSVSRKTATVKASTAGAE